MIEQHLYDLDSVFEAKCFSVSPGEVEIIVDCGNIVSPDPAIKVTIEDNLAAGVVARGLLAAILQPTGNDLNLGNCAGGVIWVRPEETVSTSTSLNIVYQKSSGVQKSASVEIPAGTPRGYAVRALMESERISGELDDFDRAVSITDASYSKYKFSVLIGQGEYPYLFNLPEKVPIVITIAIRKTASAEGDIESKIQHSVERFLEDFAIGEKLEFSDVIQYIYNDHDTGRKFSGIDTITNVLIVGNAQSISGFNQNIIMDNDQRIIPGTVVVHSVP